MKAAISLKYGLPYAVEIVEITKPVPKNNEVLIKIHASTVNRTDCGFRSADYFITRFWTGLFKPRKQPLGCEFAGEIEAIGDEVKSWKIGDRIVGFNDKKFGGHTEYITLNENEAFAKLPANFSYHEAAPLLEGAHYALCNIRAAKVKNGQNVLVNGATGAIGSAAVQLLKYFGVNITAVCNTQNKELVKSLGADHVIDYTGEDFTKTGQVFDFVFDAVGKSSFRQCKPLLKKGGIYISTELGKNAENIFLALSTPFFCSSFYFESRR
jgi:NADPH:quinone reductase-like Zn-dependent oxidoreductase